MFGNYPGIAVLQGGEDVNMYKNSVADIVNYCR